MMNSVYHGPRRLTRVRQVYVPVSHGRELDLEAGSELGPRRER